MLVVALAAAFGGGCDFGQNGIAPPVDRIFLPTGIVADPLAPLLYVVNSNSDLRYNAGTIAVVDLSQVQAIRTRADIPVCVKTRFSRTEDVPYESYCCRDLVDSNIINCTEPQFIQPEATVALGSFGGDVQLQRFERDDQTTVRRLFVAVRAEPSITFADVTVSPEGKALIRCTGARGSTAPQAAGAYCEDDWRIRRPSGVTPGALVLPEEPHTLLLDEATGSLYVGHLTVVTNNEVQGGGVSSIDVCRPQAENSVRFAGLARTTFLPATLSQAVVSLSLTDPAGSHSAQPSPSVFATARYSTAVSGLVLRDDSQAKCLPCDPANPPCHAPERDLTLVPAESFYSPAFLPRGADIRGILFSEDDSQAFVLHRNDPDILTSPPALVVLDRAHLADGTVVNTPTAILELCSGPTGMKMHDAGRGNRIYVTCYDGGQIFVVDPFKLEITAAIDVGAGPTSLVFSELDRSVAYVASFANSHLSVIDLDPASPTENRVVLRIGLPHGFGE